MPRLRQSNTAATTVFAETDDDVFARLAEALAEEFGDYCLIYVRSEALGRLVPIATSHPDWSTIAGFASSTWSGSLVAATLAGGATIAVGGNPGQLGAWVSDEGARLLREAGVTALLGVPVRAPNSDQVIGGVLLSRASGGYTAGERDAVAAAAAEFAAAIDHERLALELHAQLDAIERIDHARRLADARFSATFRDAAIGMWLFALTPPYRLLEANRAFADMVGYRIDQLLALEDPGVLLHPEDRPEAAAALAGMLDGSPAVAEFDVRMVRRTGEVVPCRATISIVRNGKDVPLHALGQVQDLRAARRHQAVVARQLARQNLLSTLGRDALEGRRSRQLAEQVANALLASLEIDAACVLHGDWASCAPAGIGIAAADVELPPACRTSPCVLRAGGAGLPAEWERHGIRQAVVVPIGDAGWLAALSRQQREPDDIDLDFLTNAAALLAAAAERERTENELRHRTLHDPLTGFANRALFVDRVMHALAGLGRSGGTLAVLSVDIDRFGRFNDTLGHHLGDEVLRQVGQRCAGALRVEDTVARVGGDEFWLLCENVGGERGAIAVAERLMAACEQPLWIGERELRVTVSAGVALAAGSGGSADALLRDADVAQHRVKERTGGGYELFDTTMRQRVVERRELEDDLRRAIQTGGLALHYQPLVSLQDRQIVGVEALVRWPHPSRGLVSPADFIPIAEASGLIVGLGSWVLNEACRQLARWSSDAALAGLTMSVNLSGVQLSAPSLPEEIASTLERTGVDPGQLTLELTESVLMEETDSPTAVLQRIRELGVRLALDDFGTGYSSLNYIKRFPIQAVKVDRSFVSGIADEESDRHILRAIVNMATALDVSVVAEGVETLEQASWLASMGCDCGQGFGLARPAPADAIEPLLRDGLPHERLGWTLEAPVPAFRERPPGPSEPSVGLKEAAEVLGVSLSTLRRWADAGRIEAVRTQGGHRRFPASEVRRLAALSDVRASRTGTLRSIEPPTRPLDALADALDTRTAAFAVRALYEPGHEGWFATLPGERALGEWTAALRAAARAGETDAALAATHTLATTSSFASVSVAELHALVERVGELVGRRLAGERAARDVQVDARRLFALLRRSILAEHARPATGAALGSS